MVDSDTSVMVVVGPLVGLGGVFGLFGAALGLLIGALIRQRAKDPNRAARLVSWSWALLVAGGGVALGVGALWLSPPDALNGAVALLFVWLGISNAISGAVVINEMGARQSTVA
jgi:hypothetical protein